MEEQPREQHEQHLVYRRASHGIQLDSMRQNSELCDITIKVNDKEMRAHKVVLAAGLRYFHSLFSTNFQESNQNVITITTVKEENMEALISFAYTGEIQLTVNNVLSLLEDSDYLNEEDVKEACVGFLCDNIKPEMSIQILQFANTIDCTPLKESAKHVILENFATVSSLDTFYDLDITLLREILSSDEVYSSEPRKYFESIVKWIIHDMPNRRNHLQDLLGLIWFVQLSTNYLVGYLYENINPENDAIIREIMSFHRQICESQGRPRNPPPLHTRVVTIDRAMLSHIQIFDPHRNSWSLRYSNIDHVHYTVSTVFKNKLFIIGGRTDVACVADVKAVNCQLNSMTNVTPMSTARRDCAVAASSTHLYVCGGRGDDGLAMNLVERYIPRSNTWETLSSMNFPRYNAAAVVLEGCVYVLGGFIHDNEEVNVVERYDPARRQWVQLEPMHHSRSSFGVTVLNNRIYACGGWEKESVECYDSRANRWVECTSMQKKRDSFLVVSVNGKLMAIGGDANRTPSTVEMYDPYTRQWTNRSARGLHNKYVSGGVVQI